MYFKYCYLILLFNRRLIDGFRLFETSNIFKNLLEELHTEDSFKLTFTRTRWFDQKLDHFDPKELRTWKMRYFQNLQYSKFNGPIYLFLGGESEASDRWVRSGLMYELGIETNGAMFTTEHRYYGASKPYQKNNSTNVEYFKYLTIRQSLADNAKFIEYLKSRPRFNKSKVVVVGASYSANLAAWMKLLYPKLVDAALASSGPVLAKKDFYEYMEKVSNNYERYGTSACMDNIEKIFSRYERLFKTTDGIEQLKKEENICEDCDLQVKENKQIFFSFKLSEFMTNSQNGNVSTIENHCRMIEDSLQLQESQEQLNLQVALKGENCSCSTFNGLIEEHYYPQNDWLLNWKYQVCTELGYFQTLTSESQPFTNNLGVELSLKICSELFGPEFNEARVDAGVKRTNEFFGGLKPNVTEVIFSNGELDPWSTISVLEDLSRKTPAIVIPGASHCRDIISSTQRDSEELKAARIKIKDLIKKYIGVKRLNVFQNVNKSNF